MINAVKKAFKTGFFHIFGSSVINKIVTFLSNIILVRILSKAEYGIFTYAWNIYSIIILLNGLGMEAGVLQMSSEKSGDESYLRKICSVGTRIGLMFDLVLAVVMLGIGMCIPLKVEGAKELVCALCLLPAFQFLYHLTTVSLRSQKRNQQYAKITMLNTMMIFIVSIIGALCFQEMGLILGYYVAYSVSIVVGYFAFNVQLFSKKSKLEIKERNSLLSISLVSMLNTGISQLLYLLDVFVLGIIVAEETVLASYKVATIIPSALVFIPVSLITYLYPYFAEHRQDGVWCLKRYGQVVIGLGMFNLLITVVLYVLAPTIIELLYGEIYLDALPVFRLLAVNYFISGTFRVLSGNLLVTQRKLKFNSVVAIVSGLINVVADYFFISWWGSLGAAYATVVVVIVSSVMSTTYLIYTFKKNRVVIIE